MYIYIILHIYIYLPSLALSSTVPPSLSYYNIKSKNYKATMLLWCYLFITLVSTIMAYDKKLPGILFLIILSGVWPFEGGRGGGSIEQH